MGHPENLPDWIAEVTIRYSAPGQSGHVENILGMSSTDGMTPINQGDLDNFIDGWQDEVVVFLANNVTQISATAKNGSVELFNTTTKAGTLSADMFPLNNAYLVRKNTSTPGRTGQGRIYLPGVPEGCVNNDGLLVGSCLTNLQGAVDDFLADIATHDLDLRLIAADGLSTKIVNSLTVVPLVANQRRRIRR